ncbi:MAG: pyocin activator PrtN family protein [Endozoicomonas sp.]
MKTVYMLLAEFDKACVTLDELIEHGYLSVNRKTANALASTNKLPFPVFRIVELTARKLVTWYT